MFTVRVRVRVRVRARAREWNFFFSRVKVTKICVLLVAVQHSDIRPTLRDIMMYSQDWCMKNLSI